LRYRVSLRAGILRARTFFLEVAAMLHSFLRLSRRGGRSTQRVRPTWGPIVFVVASFALAGCSSIVIPNWGDASTLDAFTSDVPLDSTRPPDVQRIPVNHRADNSVCLTIPGPGDCATRGGPPPACRTDVECSANANGRCIQPPFGPVIIRCGCSYDACTSDSQCTMGGPCACHGSPYLFGLNACVAGNCQIDRDCGAGRYCSPSRGPMTCGLLAGYYCHTAQDTCVDDSDCPSNQGCLYIASTGHWSCTGPLIMCQ
jgi:hypothetical protein